MICEDKGRLNKASWLGWAFSQPGKEEIGGGGRSGGVPEVGTSTGKGKEVEPVCRAGETKDPRALRNCYGELGLEQKTGTH